MNKWKMNRAGLLNFWYYDEEIFDFADGKLLLRGSNGSGKSVTMQSFLPVLLDGKTSPDRLDPFGSKARKMEDYLLGEKEIVNRDERTGYLFIEFKRQETGQYRTIGIGLQAKRNKQMKFWGFVITDNRRIGVDFELYKLEKNAGEKQKIPLSRIELENLIAEGGHVVQTKSEYMKLVNKYIFGFETMEAYEDLIKLLIQLRSPKLSKDFKPTVIYDILEAALPPLTDEDLRHLSDTIEQMDQTKQQIDQMDREAQAIRALNKIYHQYNQKTLAEQADEYLAANKRHEKEQKTYKEKSDELSRLKQETDSLNNEISALNLQLKTYQKQEERLKSHKIWNLEKEFREEERKLGQESESLNRKQEQLQGKREKEIRLKDTRNQLEATVAEREQKMEDMLLDMANDAEEASFADAHALNKEDFRRYQKENFDFTVWVKEAGNHRINLEKIAEKLRNFEDLKATYQEKDKNLADENRQLDEVVHQEGEWKRLFEEDKEKKLNEIHGWLEETKWIDIEEAQLQETARSIYSLYEPTSYEVIKEPFRKAVFQYEQQKHQDLSRLTFEQKQTMTKLKEKQAELKEWKEKKDPEPEADLLTKEAREKLQQEGTSFVPFYAAVDFTDHVEEEVRKRMEAALMDSGMLDALITEENINVEHDRILVPQPNAETRTLADYLKPDLDSGSSISNALVDDVLRSITIETDGDAVISINEQGTYQLGLLKGHALPVTNVRYIGRSARQRFREEQIQLIQQEIDALNEENQAISDKITETEAAISHAKARLDVFPDDEDLDESFRQIKDVRLRIEHHQRQTQKLSDEVKAVYNEYKSMKRVIDEQTRSYNLEITLDAYREGIAVINRYEKDLSALEKAHIQYVNDLERLSDNTTALEELEQEIIEIEGETRITGALVAELKQNMQQIEIQMEQEGIADIRKQIADVQQALQEIDEQLEEKKTTKPRKENEIEHMKKEVDNKNRQVDFWSKMTSAWGKSFQKELERGFVDFGTDENRIALANLAAREFGHLLKEKDSDNLASRLTQEFYKQQSDLMEYQMHSYKDFLKIPAWMEETALEEEMPHIEKWKQKMGRQIIELNYGGKQVNPYTVQKQIELEQARQESFLDEQDRELYEEILFNSVGQKLRARIRRAEQWVNQMKKLMETRDTSSGLTFSIRWKPRTAESETEMDTMDLVHLLKQDPKLLKEEDLEKITTHFRSKIAKAKEMVGDSNEMQTLLQVLKEVLDYRKWFSFVLYFQREGEKKRELNNNQFYKFSGGEKALAMYIPLFTACYSRYLEADSDAPYIISLDEAFAGVDENNIREMFEIVEQLGFDYIMNSQVLWGDYDTISELSICELIRPKNDDVVSVLRYHWDGNKMNVTLPVETEGEETDSKVKQ